MGKLNAAVIQQYLDAKNRFNLKMKRKCEKSGMKIAYTLHVFAAHAFHRDHILYNMYTLLLNFRSFGAHWPI